MYNLKETEKFNKIFNFIDDGTNMEWDIIFANSKRIREFIKYYNNNKLNNEEKITLMALILASFDDYLNEINDNSDIIWEEISDIIKQERELFEGVIYYWSLLTHIKEFNYYEGLENDDEDLFAITPYIRKTFYRF